MRCLAIGLVVAAINVAATVAFAQSSTVTNCMMTCNASAANCQTACLIPPIQAPNQATTGSNLSPQLNSTAGTNCLMGCSTSQITCQTNCARQSPSP